MSDQLIPFSFESHAVRTFLDDRGEPWFCAADVCAVLGYVNSRQAINKNCNVKGVSKRDILTEGSDQRLTFINEGNLVGAVRGADRRAGEHRGGSNDDGGIYPRAAAG